MREGWEGDGETESMIMNLKGVWNMTTDTATENDIDHMVLTWQKNNQEMP